MTPLFYILGYLALGMTTAILMQLFLHVWKFKDYKEQKPGDVDDEIMILGTVLFWPLLAVGFFLFVVSFVVSWPIRRIK